MKTTGAGPSRPEEWEPSFDDLKHYPHFDAPLRLSEIKQIVNDPTRVTQNAFFPLIQYEKKWQPFRTPRSVGDKAGKAQKPEKKSRKIRYAARRDAYIYAKYRRILAPLYEAKLVAEGITDVPIAYRKIPGDNGRGKCNIEFARDVFDAIADLGDCYVITLDISKFFESLDHKKIEEDWCDLLQVQSLPSDHRAVFSALTDYRWVDQTEAYRRLGYFGDKTNSRGQRVEGYLVPFDKMPKQLCTPQKFRAKIAGKGPLPSIIKRNENAFGIPQGTPISDLIANVHLMDFDKLTKQYALKHNGRVFRYSDDILLVIQAENDTKATEVEQHVRNSISSFGNQLVIKESKSSIHHFRKAGDHQECRHIQGAGKNGLEYLGFRFDGSRVYLRDSTLSNLKRKMTFSGRIRAKKHRRRYPDRSPTALIESFNFDEFFQNFMRVEDFDKTSSVRSWTFWTYARRAVKAFGDRGKPIDKQLKFLKPDGKRNIEEVLSS
ncbi:MAG: reverse transcriptase domain-containing protein [Pseudomonadota bacterium]